jgi:hypothetical protein
LSKNRLQRASRDTLFPQARDGFGSRSFFSCVRSNSR